MRDSRVIALTVESARSKFMGMDGCGARKPTVLRLASVAKSGYYARSFSATPASRLQLAWREHCLTGSRLYLSDSDPERFTREFIRITGFFMANSAQARKRARQAAETRVRNASLKSMLRSAVKKVKKAIATGDKAVAQKEFHASQAVIDRIADKRIVHKNTASRHKSRLAQAIKALA
jgi:small subunit ribosomal protein S20